MSETATCRLRLPKSLKAEVARLAKKVSALETEQFFIERAERTDLEAFRRLLRQP